MAFGLDLALGDPNWSFHPIRLIGRCADGLEPIMRRLSRNQKVNGTVFNLMLVGGTISAIWLIGRSIKEISWLAWTAYETAILYFSFALGALRNECHMTLRSLETGDIESARQRVQMMVSRNLKNEDKRGILRALMETLTENLSDGVIAPLLFAMLGGAPLAMGYKAINTLDSMVGYKNKKYLDFGWFSARLDDATNFIPARITGGLIILVSALTKHQPILAIKAWAKDAQRGPSPNGGIPIVTFAGALDIALGGDCRLAEGDLIRIPTVGGKRFELTEKDATWASRFITLSAILLMAAYCITALTLICLHSGCR